MPELLCLPYSPWSEKARWALDARAVPYRVRNYQPLLGEPALRFALRRIKGVVSVPVLFDEGLVLADSLDIARYAGERGDGPALFPEGAERSTAEYNELSERGLSAGRALALRRMLEDEGALREQVPRALAKPLGKLGVKIAALGVQRTLRKYGAHASDDAEQRRVLCEVLDRLRSDLTASRNEPKTLLSSFSFADIAMAQVLVFVRPPTSGLRMRAGSRRVFEDAQLVERYADLLAWRDALYATYRKSP